MRGSSSKPSLLHGLEENVAKYGTIFGFYFGQTPAVVLADYDLIKEAFKSEKLAARPSIEPVQEARPGTYVTSFSSISYFRISEIAQIVSKHPAQLLKCTC